jgi:trigger factor
MQITETSADGLKHEFMVTVGADDIARQVEARLEELNRSLRLPGFRPGKVPLRVLRQRYGKSVMGEVLERAVNDSSAAALRERNLRPALQPKVEIVSFNEGNNLEYKMAIEVLPEIKPMNFSEITLERLKPTIADEEIDKALERIAKQQRKSDTVDRPAEKGDVVVIDFVGSVDGTPFPGGTATDYSLELGSGSFIPGFEDKLVGVKAGDTRTLDIDFPADYGAAELAGKSAQFAVTVKSVRGLSAQPIDESLATAVGLANLTELRKAVSDRIEQDYGRIARQRLKRELLDRLAEKHEFPVPEGMVTLEFDGIWKQFEEERKRAKEAGTATQDADEAGKDDDTLKAEYRAIAERRVRLGLLLAEVGRTNQLTVTQDELNRALAQEAQRFPGQERQVVDYYRNNPALMDGLRAPIFEDKVIDFILEMAAVTDRSVPAAEILAGAAAEDAGVAESADKESPSV